MKCIPRASFSIAILDDEDFGILMEDPSGMEAFGLFVAIIIAGRSRLQLERAERVGQTDALVFADRNRHLLSMIHADQGQFDRCIAAFARVARETGGEPWVHLDQGGHLVIRSFFKFNTNTGWGGARGGAGRKSSDNQDEFKMNHLEKNGPVGGNSSVSSGLHSGTGTGTGTRNTPLTPNGGKSEQARDSRQPISIDAEPFDSGQSDPLPKAPRPKPKFETDPDEATRLILKAESIFRTDFDIRSSAGSTIGEFPAAWISEAMDIARESKAQGWGFVRKVLTRFKTQGESDTEKFAREWDKKQKTSLWNQPSHVPQPDPRRPKMRNVNALSDNEILEFETRGVA